MADAARLAPEAAAVIAAEAAAAAVAQAITDADDRLAERLSDDIGQLRRAIVGERDTGNAGLLTRVERNERRYLALAVAYIPGVVLGTAAGRLLEAWLL